MDIGDAPYKVKCPGSKTNPVENEAVQSCRTNQHALAPVPLFSYIRSACHHLLFDDISLCEMKGVLLARFIGRVLSHTCVVEGKDQRY